MGEEGVGDWQELEYDEAFDKRVKFPDFPVILVLLEGQTAPGLPFLRRLHWIITPDPSSEKDVALLLDAASGSGTRARRARALIFVLVGSIIAVLVGWDKQLYLGDKIHLFFKVQPYMQANVSPYVLKADAERALKPLITFRECAKDCPLMVDGSAWISKGCGDRVDRGGSWYEDALKLRSAYRDQYPAENLSDNVGFRVARTLAP